MDFTRMVHLLRASWSTPKSAKPNLLTCNAAISVCSRVGHLGRAVRLLNEMVCPCSVSYMRCAGVLFYTGLQSDTYLVCKLGCHAASADVGEVNVTGGNVHLNAPAHMSTFNVLSILRHLAACCAVVSLGI